VADTAWMEMEFDAVVVVVVVAAAVAAVAAAAEDYLYSLKSPQSMWNPYDWVEAYLPQAFSAAVFFLSTYRGLV
jgi:hypothetical protein